MTKHACPACHARAMEIFHRQESVPTNSCILLSTAQEARDYPRGRIELGFCDACGFISNLAFDPRLTEYSGRYEETQAYSNTFNRFHQALAGRLIEDYDLRGKKILEIGCGKGEFLKMICEMGDNKGIGFDPGFRADRLELSGLPEVEFIQDFYSEKYADHESDFLCCKMTLEHITDAGDFVGTVRRAIGERDTYVFFQIPEAKRILKECAFEDIYYEHCSYYSPGSLARLFRRNGFEVLKLDTEYEGQYLTIECRPSHAARCPEPLNGENDLDELRQLVAAFPGELEAKLAHWRGVLNEAKAAGRRVALWGSGSKAVSFLTSLEVTDEVEYVVDINPNRWNHYMSGTGHPIVSPGQLPELGPELVIVMNPVYRNEVVEDLESRGLNPRVVTL